MISRYSYPEMRAVWEPQNKFAKWLEIEVAASEANATLGIVPEEALKEIREKAGFDISRIDEIEAEVHHDVIAFLTSMAEHIGDASKYVHYGMTSSDILDTGLSLQLRDAADILIEDVKRLGALVKAMGLKYRETLAIGRSHGVHAEPITFGMKFAIWAHELKRDLVRLEKAREVTRVGQVSGAVGSYANIDPKVEAYVCEKLGLVPAEASSQVIQRDRHAEYMAALAITASTLDKMATELRHLQRTEILEAEEPFAKGQKGSSAMPHKKNPIICERVSGLARVIRGNLQAALENVALWHERDISHSSVERVILPDSTVLLDYMLRKMEWVLGGLVVNEGRIVANLELTHGLVFSQKVLLALIEKGMLREDAYSVVQRNAMKSWDEGRDLRVLLDEDEAVAGRLSAVELDAIFDHGSFLTNAGVIFERLEGLQF